MTDRQAAEARQIAQHVIEWNSLIQPPPADAPHAENCPGCVIDRLADTVDALSVRLAQAEQERDELRYGDARLCLVAVGKLAELKVRLREYEEALREIDGEARRQHLAWANFHEVAMRDPFEAESEAQDFARLILGLAGR